VLEDWVGVESSQELNQERATPLPPSAVALLKQAQIGLVFVAGRTDGGDAVQDRARKLGLTNLVVYIHRTNVPRLADIEIVTNDGIRARLTEFCYNRGVEGLVEEGRDLSRAQEWALGYGNEALLLLSSYNTPTAALTCLWHDGPQWSALFPRRPKR
jgi:deoxynucleoside triphosphate triphosphohydrolase SAMHD1